MDRKEIITDLAKFLKSEVPPDNEVTIHGESQIRIEGKKPLDKKTVFLWAEKFFESNSLLFKRKELGFLLEKFIFTITTHDWSCPPYMAIISSEYFEGEDFFR